MVAAQAFETALKTPVVGIAVATDSLIGQGEVQGSPGVDVRAVEYRQIRVCR